MGETVSGNVSQVEGLAVGFQEAPAERGVLGLVERGVAGEGRGRVFASEEEEGVVARELDDAEGGEAGLTLADDLTHAAELEVSFGECEAVGGGGKGLEAVEGGGGGGGGTEC